MLCQSGLLHSQNLRIGPVSNTQNVFIIAHFVARRGNLVSVEQGSCGVGKRTWSWVPKVVEHPSPSTQAPLRSVYFASYRAILLSYLRFHAAAERHHIYGARSVAADPLPRPLIPDWSEIA